MCGQGIYHRDMVSQRTRCHSGKTVRTACPGTGCPSPPRPVHTPPPLLWNLLGGDALSLPSGRKSLPVGSAGSETDAHSVCRVSVVMNPFPFRGSDSPWHPRPMEDGVSVHACCRGHRSLTPWHDSEEGASLLPRCPPLWVPRGKMSSPLMQGGRWRGKLPADSLFWQNHSDGWGKSNPLLFPKVTLFCLGRGVCM